MLYEKAKLCSKISSMCTVMVLIHCPQGIRADWRSATNTALSAVTSQEESHLLGSFWQDNLDSQRVCNLLIKHMVNKPHLQGILIT